MIIIKNDKEIDLMRIAGRIVAETLLLVEKEVKPGITTAELDRICLLYTSRCYSWNNSSS